MELIKCQHLDKIDATAMHDEKHSVFSNKTPNLVILS